ncbi:hypothetical protein [Paraburkholderia fynbosensis]|uniref:hypothetical protein n=1 Tax=Paraburkholderia fynbosensis TaxID=1200993 RepID=UPI001583AEA3|nr:hypothetical protein [Paraburkholderia fynbosensis]
MLKTVTPADIIDPPGLTARAARRQTRRNSKPGATGPWRSTDPQPRKPSLRGNGASPASAYSVKAARKRAKGHGRRTAFPWMQITDDMLEHAGFLPENQVLFRFDYRLGHITITPDYDYRVAGRYMTEPEAEAMLQRRANRTEQHP